MLTISEYLSIIEDRLNSIDYPQSPAGLYDPIHYTLSGGGKRVRPVLALSACDAFCGDPLKALNQAMAVEIFHNFTLLHDDMMDRADMRRGRPTVHVRWDDRTAVLSGDAMLTLASVFVGRGTSDAQYRRVNDLLNRTALEIYHGQQYDMDFEHRMDVTVDDYMKMIRLKTSVLLGCACQMGAIMAGASDEACRAIYAYGEKLGLAFQLRDDYLDTYGDPIVFGKEIGGDIVNDKKTWLLINALLEDTSGVVKREIAQPSEPCEKIERVRLIYNSLDLAQRCNQLISKYVDEAIYELGKAGLTPAAYQFFAELAEGSRSRTH